MPSHSRVPRKIRWSTPSYRRDKMSTQLQLSPNLDKFSLHNYLPPRQPLSERWSLLASGLLAIYIISYLAHIPPPKSAGYRQDGKNPVAQMGCYALLPFALGCPSWFWLTVDFSSGESDHSWWKQVDWHWPQFRIYAVGRSEFLLLGNAMRRADDPSEAMWSLWWYVIQRWDSDWNL